MIRSTRDNDPLFGARLKLRRAHSQLKCLMAEIKDFIFQEPKPYAIIRKEHLDTSANAAIITGIISVQKNWPDPWSAIIGEIIHDLRSLLDYLIYELVALETGTHLSIANKTQFPIFKTEVGYNSRGEPRLLQGVGVQAKTVIKSLQPFSTGEGTSSPLWYLQELSNRDKHREILLTGAFRHPTEKVFIEVPSPAQFMMQADGPFKDGTEFFRVVLEPCNVPIADRLQKVKMNTDLPFYVAFEEPLVLRGAGVIPALNSIGVRTGQIIKRISEEFFKIPTIPIG